MKSILKVGDKEYPIGKMKQGYWNELLSNKRKLVLKETHELMEEMKLGIEDRTQLLKAAYNQMASISLTQMVEGGGTINLDVCDVVFLTYKCMEAEGSKLGLNEVEELFDDKTFAIQVNEWMQSELKGDIPLGNGSTESLPLDTNGQPRK